MDIALKINKYLEKFSDQRDPENDCLNIVDDNIFNWSFTKIPQPTEEDLAAAEVEILAEDLHKEKLVAIAALEAQVTSRRYREAFLTGDKSFIENIENQIQALRASPQQKEE
jgi:hypothetical protein